MDSSEGESDEDFELQHWNNWSEPENEFSLKQSSNETKTSYWVFNKSEIFPSRSVVSDSKFGNWIPPAHFIQFKGSKGFLSTRNNESQNIESGKSDAEKKDDNTISSNWKVNEDWGERVELNDVAKFNEGDSIWGVINLSLFDRIRLWVNQYKNLCVLAEGTISKVGSTEASLISIVNPDLLRKMLGLSSAQWACLCEEVLESNASLNFDAFLDCDLTSKSSLDKMWFFLCKRRHFLQEQCMLVKLSGAVKCLKRFEIIPKLVVQEIRNVMGKPIS